jgi:general stress protein 26
MIQIFKQKNDLALPFIQQKINELQTALFFAISNTVLKIPSHIVTAAEADEEGRIWFAIPKPVQSVGEFEKEFPAKLDFFKKGKEFYLKIEGNASIISEPEEIKNAGPIIDKLKQKVKHAQMLFIQVDIKKADYYEAKPNPATFSISNSMQLLFNWLFTLPQGSRQIQLTPIPLYTIHNNGNDQRS